MKNYKVIILVIVLVFSFTISACGSYFVSDKLAEGVTSYYNTDSNVEYDSNAVIATEKNIVVLNDRDILHNFFVDKYKGKHATEIYKDITHDSREDLIVVGADKDDYGTNSVYLHIYTNMDGNVQLVYDAGPIWEAHSDGYSHYYLIEEDKQCYLAVYTEGVWQGLGGAGYEIFYLDGSTPEYIEQEFYNTNDNLEGEALVQEMSKAWDIWQEYYTEYENIIRNGFMLMTDFDGVLGACNKSAIEFLGTTPLVEDTSGAKISDKNYGNSHDNATERGMIYISNTRNYNKYFDGNEWGEFNSSEYTDVGCAISCKTILLAYLNAKNPKTGDRYYVRDLIAANGKDLVSHDGEGVAEALKDNNISEISESTSKLSLLDSMSKLDEYIDLYKGNPGTYSPVMVSMEFMSDKGISNHYVIVVGKESDSSYVCIDTNLNNRVHFVPSDYVDTNGTTYSSKIKRVFILKRN